MTRVTQMRLTACAMVAVATAGVALAQEDPEAKFLEDAVRGQVLNAETRALIDTLRKLSRQSYAAGLGALYAYESQFPGVASAKIEGLIDRYGIADEPTLRFFRVHESADVEHSAVCRDLLDRLPEDQKAEAIAAGEELAGALWNFLSGVEARASIN